MVNLYGIGLANGPQDLSRVIALGCDHYLALEFQAAELATCPGERYLRLWDRQFLRRPVEETAAEIRRRRGVLRHVIPWNEANLTYEIEAPSDRQFDQGWARETYAAVAQYYLRLREQLVGDDIVLHFPAWSPGVWYRENLGLWRDAALAAPIVDVHAYGTAAQMLDIVDWYLSVLPDKELLITEFNFGGGNEVDEDWWAREAVDFVTALGQRPRVRGAIGFIWQWHNPDMNLKTTLDWLDRPIERAVREAVKPDRQSAGSTDAVDLMRAKTLERDGSTEPAGGGDRSRRQDEVRQYAIWVLESLASGAGETRGAIGYQRFRAHLRAIGADADDPVRYGWPLPSSPSVVALPALVRAEARLYAEWVIASLANNNEEVRGPVGRQRFLAHLQAIGADERDPRRYGWPD